jgi:uncharacterized protein YigE (DUF2233 family)
MALCAIIQAPSQIEGVTSCSQNRRMVTALCATLQAPSQTPGITLFTRSQNGDGFVSVQELENALGGTGGEAGKIIERVAFKQVGKALFLQQPYEALGVSL